MNAELKLLRLSMLLSCEELKTLVLLAQTSLHVVVTGLLSLVRRSKLHRLELLLVVRLLWHHFATLLSAEIVPTTSISVVDGVSLSGS